MLELAPAPQVIWGPGHYRLAVVTVEFPDAREKPAASWMPRIIHEADAYFREVSGGVVRWLPAADPPTRIRLRRPSAGWRLERRSLADRVRFWKRVMKRTQLRHADAVLVVVPRAAFMRGCFAVGPRWNSPRLDHALRPLDIGTPRGAVVKTSTPWGTVMHELGHVLGLPDLYDYEFARDLQHWSVRASRYVGSWDLMGRTPADATSFRPHPMAWTKTLAGWITPVAWTARRDHYEVGPGPTAGAVRVDIAPGRALFVEGRLQKGFDAGLPSDGVLISVADEHLSEGRGPLQLLKPDRPRSSGGIHRRVAPLAGAAFQPQEECSYGDISVRVLSRTPQGFGVSIARR
ncbi:MAG TPA: immune inhibitor A domain-containing protein [bacterium]